MDHSKINTAFSSVPVHGPIGLDRLPCTPPVEKEEFMKSHHIQQKYQLGSFVRFPDTPESNSPESNSPEPKSPVSSKSAGESATESIPVHSLDTATGELPAEISPQDAPRVAVLGIGYVGTHLVESFSEVYPVVGFDVSAARVDQLRAEAFGAANGVQLTTQRADLRAATHFLISVPTLLRADKSVNDGYLRSALDIVREAARPGATVVVESSVAVGMTRALLGPLCAERRLFGGMSPERVDPGRTDPPMRAIPKILSGLTAASLDRITRLYGPVFDTVVPVSSPEVAEMTKLYENCQRMMCIAYANEMADACLPLNIDPFEVARAAASKPFGYMPFMPSAGVGGHCIPVNPYYLLSTCEFPLLGAAADRMADRPAALARRTVEALKAKQLTRKASVLVVGVGFKAGQSVLSNSPGLAVAQALASSSEDGAALDIDVMFADKLVSQEAVPAVRRLADSDWTAARLAQFDKIIVVVRQTGMDMGVLAQLPSSVDVEMWSRA